MRESNKGRIRRRAITGVYRKKDTQGIVLVTIDKEKSLKPFGWNRSKRKG
jgi:hypothetical protein